MVARGMVGGALLAPTLALVALACAVPAQKITEVVWGFDGTVRRGAFNPVSILVDNPGPRSFDDHLVLRRAGAGAPIARRVYVAPKNSRWVQFY